MAIAKAHEPAKVFISYSHADEEYLSRLKIHLRPIERQGLIEVWSDAKINAGENWRREIEKAIHEARVAILLISADFLASDFIQSNELPAILKKAEEHQGLEIIPVILKPSLFLDTQILNEYQAANDPEKPLIGLSEVDQEGLWVQVVKRANALVNSSAQEEWALEDDDWDGYDAEIWSDDRLLLAEEIRTPQAINSYFVYRYHFIDSPHYMKSAREVLGGTDNTEEILEEVGEKLKKAGWEGDGEVQLLWIPPFMGAGVEDTHGILVWHVKQRNNGTSWFLSPVPLPFSRLLEQND